MGAMKVLLTLALSGAALLAQAPPAEKKAAPKAAAPAAKTAAPAGAPTKTGTTTKTGAATKKAAPRAAAGLSNPALARATAPELYRAKFVTTKGDFVVEVNRSWAPIGADRFYNLVRVGYFNDASFFRVIQNFIVQFGMHANPAINAVWDKASIKDDPVKQGNKRGTIVYAKPDAPNARTTQFFINLKDNSASLDGLGFAAFGTVSEGMDVVDKIFQIGEGADMGGRGPRQDRIAKEGKAYLDKNYPQLDSIKTATIIFPEGPPPAPAPATKKSAPAATKTGTAAPATKSAAPAAKKADPAAAPAKK
jgi:peptidyl-prolyl cis-trans isomerase A (cyclophilin A)